MNGSAGHRAGCAWRAAHFARSVTWLRSMPCYRPLAIAMDGSIAFSVGCLWYCLALVAWRARMARAAGAYQMGSCTWAAPRPGARHLSPAVGRVLSAQTLKVLDSGFLLPSKIAEEHQQRLSAAFHSLRLPEGGTPQSALLFRRSSQLGANAFTLPDGTIIVLDDLITGLDDDQQTLAVLAHELGHAHERHGLQMLLRSSVVGAFLTFYVGDVSTLLAAAPAAVVEARYSQEFERQADDYAAALLRQNGMSPGLLADALTKLAQLQPALSKGGYLASHPATDERIRRLRLPASPASAR